MNAAVVALALALVTAPPQAETLVTLRDAGVARGELRLRGGPAGQVLLDLHRLAWIAHAATGATPRPTSEYRRSLRRAKNNFAHLLAGMVACANVFRQAGWCSCDGVAALDLYDMLAASSLDDPVQPPGLRMRDYFGAAIEVRAGASVFVEIDNPALFALGFRGVSCHPVINAPEEATCLFEPRPS